MASALTGLMPIMWSMGTGANVMKRVAAPMVGGLATSFLMEMLVYPAIYLLWKGHTEVKSESLQSVNAPPGPSGREMWPAAGIQTGL